MSLDSTNIRQEFPILAQNEEIYLDSAATAQKPNSVINSMNSFYKEHNANVHRGMHELTETATVLYENARKTVAEFLGCKPYEIVFTKNCTEALNLVARSWAKANLQKGETIALSILEHHSNIVPWQQIAEEVGCNIAWIDIDDTGNIAMDSLEEILQKHSVTLISITGQSNVTGACPPLKDVVEKAHAAGALCCVDAAQLVAHKSIDITNIDCDFLSFSGHKLYGPTGIGVLYAKKELLQGMPPFLGGGMMIKEVTKEGFRPTEIPAKFEAGTPPIVEAIGLAEAIHWISQYDWNDIETHDKELCTYTLEKLQEIEGVRTIGTPRESIISFTIEGVHPHDLTEIMGRNGVHMRAGHHCAQPLHDHLGITASTRLSIGIYTTKEDIDAAINVLRTALQTLR